MAALAGITYALIEGPERGFGSLSVLIVLVAGLVGAVAFVLVERASPAPMLPLHLFANRQFSVTNGVTFVVYGALGGALFLFPVELQVVNGYTPLQSGVALLPLTFVMLVLSARSGRLASKIGPRLADGRRPGGRRRRPRPPGPFHGLGLVPDRGPAGGAGVRSRVGDHGRAAHVDGDGVGPDRARRASRRR